MDTSKIIKGVVNSGRYTVTAPIIKEDYGLYLQIEGVELPSTYQVDFSNDEHHGTSVTMIGNSDGVLIPSQFISSGKDVFAFLYHVGADFGRTVYKFRIPNKLRPDRTNEQPTPEEQSTIDQAIGALNEAVEQTAQDVIDADASASAASQSAENAHDSAVDAQNYAETAQTSANNASASASQASTSATASAQSASASAQIKADVEDLVDDAQGYAQASAQSASASANSASQAQGYAQSASASANSASGYASQAQSSANTANTKAQDASGYAQTASQKATEASQSAENAQTYVTQARQAKAGAETAQTFAENARDDAETARDEAVTAKENAEQAKADAESARDEAQQAVASISGALADKAPVITDTASGSIASFSDGADDLPLKSLVVNIDPVQDLHGQDSPYPAGGGKNKLRYPFFDTTKTVNGVTFIDNGDGTLSIRGTATSVTNFNLAAYNTAVLSEGDYAVSLEGGSSNCYFVYGGGDSGISFNTAYGTDVYAKTIHVAESGIIGFCVVQVPANATVNLTVKPMIRLASVSDATFAPYENLCPISGWTEVNVNHSDADTSNPTTITIQLGQTVYGGKLDVLSGVLTVYPYYASYNGETLTGEWISDRDKYVSGTTPTIGAQVVNIGAQGVTVQLEPHEVESLHGVNNLWADSGDTEVEYRADTKLFIERLTAPDSADMIADANIQSGKYFMVGNSLYLATANIANGSAIVVGTNCIRKSLSEALNEINA